VTARRKIRIGNFLFEREGKYDPSSEIIAGLKRIDKIDFSGRFHIVKKPSKTNMILICPNDLVISGINVSKGALGIYSGQEDLCATIHYSSYTFDTSQIDIEYFKRFLKSSVFVRLIQDQVKGGIKTEIKPKHLLSVEMDLPNIDEQRVVVSRFENVETEDYELKNELNNRSILLAEIRQQIRMDAITGKLSAKWRSQKRETEPAGEILARIAAEKSKLIENKIIKAQKPVAPVNEKEISFELPSGWNWCRLNDLIYENPRNGYSPRTVAIVTGTKTLKLGATTTGKFDRTKLKYVDEFIPEDSFLWLKKRDILIQRGNSIDFVGVSAVYEGEDSEFIYPDLMMKLKPALGISEIYLHHVLMSPMCRKYFRDNATGSQKSMPKINQAVVSNTLIPICSTHEQLEIVSIIKRLFRICDQIDKCLEDDQTHAQQFMPTVLSEAFFKTEVD
jgi:type I restriction enzyme, S subunit